MQVKSSTKTMSGAKILIETLKNLGVDTVFGYPGGIVLDLYNELYDCGEIKHILTRHEQSAVHAAEGYAAVSGKCGVVLVTSGPGATNTLTGIVNAYHDGTPLIVLTGQVFNDLIGKNAFQEADICDITKSCTKKVFRIKSAAEIQSTLIDAMKIAMSGKKGPVTVDLVKDIFTQNAEFEEFEFNFETLETPSVSSLKINSTAERLANSVRPVIVAGGGVARAGAENELYEFSSMFNIPVVDTMRGLGTFPQEDEKYFGMIGIFGDNSANAVVKEADLVLSLGAKFNDRITCMFGDIDLGSKFIQIDINEKEIFNFVRASDYAVADIKEFLPLLGAGLSTTGADFGTWLEAAQELKFLNVKRERKTNLLHSFEVIRKIEEFTKGRELTFTSEVGQHQLWAVQNLKFAKNRRILVSGGFGTMGFGFPAAAGASIAQNNKSPVVCITGDGSFQMGLHELATCKDYGLNVKIMILNNGYLGMVRQLQEKSFPGRYSQTKISNPDFVTLAKSYGIRAERVTRADEIESVLKNAFDNDETYIVDFAVEPMEVL